MTEYTQQVLYEITEEEKNLILQSLSNFSSLVIENDFEHGMVTFSQESDSDNLLCDNLRNLWEGVPPISNVKFVVEYLGYPFAGSETDVLCRRIHNSKVHEPL